MLMLMAGCLLLSEPPPGADKALSLRPQGPWVDVLTLNDAVCAANEEGEVRCKEVDYLLNPVRAAEGVTVLDSDGRDACWLYSDGGAGCWEGGPTDLLAQDAPDTGDFVRLRVMDGMACAFPTTNRPTCWGENDGGRLSNIGNDPILDIAFYGSDGISVTTGGDLIWIGEEPFAWGKLPDDMNVQTVATDLNTFVAIGPSQGHAFNISYEEYPLRGSWMEYAGGTYCASQADGTLSCAGEDTLFQASPPENASFTDFDMADAYGCGITLEGRVRCWGDIQEEFPLD